MKYKQIKELYPELLEEQVCSVCGKRFHFSSDQLRRRVNSLKLGKSTIVVCSAFCASQSQEAKLKRKETNLLRFGVDNYAKTQQHKQSLKDNESKRLLKMQQTCLNKYGVDNYSKSIQYNKNIDVIQNKIKQTCLNKYNTNSYSKTKEFKNYIKENKDIIQNKIKQTCLDKYGVDRYTKTQEFKDKVKQTCLNKYGETTNLKVQECKDKIKQTCLNKYGVDNYSKTQECLNKIYLSKKHNNSFNKSKQEEKVYQLLLTKLKKEDIIRQYRNDLYPFNCDFYIKSLDLYIEYNGTWTHGPKSFDGSNKEHLELLELWKSKNTDYFKNAIYTWTVLDVKKLKCFKKNKLNYKIFWNIEEIKQFIGGI